jgi:multisubunit Na+/H+ antiporter MnhB subunit
MRSRTRKLIGAVGLLAIAVVWPLFMLGFGHSNLSRSHTGVQIAVFVVLGLVWLVPAAWLIRWMQKRDRDGA